MQHQVSRSAEHDATHGQSRSAVEAPGGGVLPAHAVVPAVPLAGLAFGNVATIRRTLIPAGQPNAGRLPDVERESLIKLLEANGFARSDRDKARSDDANKTELSRRYEAVKDLDSEIGEHAGKENWQVRKRTKLRAQLEAEYNGLLGFAESCRDEANDFYDQAVADAATALGIKGPGAGKARLFKGQEPWKTYKDIDVPKFFTGTLPKFASPDLFAEDVFKRTNLVLSPAKPAAPGLSATQLSQLTDEKQGVNDQLNLWQAIAANAQGCNAQGTWGTSKGGSGAQFAATTLSNPVWLKLKQWWVKKAGAYVTPSDTTTWSLKMWRDVGGQNLSPTFNYHVNVN